MPTNGNTQWNNFVKVNSVNALLEEVNIRPMGTSMYTFSIIL